VVVLMLAYRGLFPTFDSTRPLTVADADKCRYIPIRLPRSASNIWVHFEKHGLGTFDQRFRFQAPLADCLSYANTVVTNYPNLTAGWTKILLQGDNQGLPGTSQDPLYPRLPWFDKHGITNGILFQYDFAKVSGGPSVFMSMWIDRDHSTLYFMGGD